MKSLSVCPICGSGRLAFAYAAPTTRGQDRRKWAVSECRECTHLFMNPQPTWEDLQAYYTDSYDPYDPMHGSNENDDADLEVARREGKIRHIAIPAHKRLLDVGCGGGRFLRLAKKLGAIEQGVEPSEHGARVATSQGLNVFNGTLESFFESYSGPGFDIITANHVIEHVPLPVQTLSVMRRLLAPGGMIWISVPNADYPLCRALNGRWHSSDLPYHLMQFTPASMARAGKLAGLVLQGQTTESIPRIVAASIRQYLRYRWLILGRFSKHIRVIDSVAESYAQKMDSARRGEAILTEFLNDNNL